MDPIDAPVCRTLFRQGAFITAQEKGGSRSAGCGFYLDETFVTALVKRENIVTRTVAIFFSHPSYPFSKVNTIYFDKARPLDFDCKFFASLAKRTVAIVSVYRVEFPN